MNSPWFANTSVILFLNKKDLFSEKIKTVDLRVPNPRYKAIDLDDSAGDEPPLLFSDYTGGHDYNAAVKYIKKLFLSRVHNKEKLVFVKLTCATDTEQVRAVFDSCREIILHDNLLYS